MTMLEGKVALVTGAGRGLGWGVAKALGLAGAKVCATDVNETEMEASFKGIDVGWSPTPQSAFGCSRP